MSEEKRPQKPMSIEQAGNFLKEKKETLAADMKAEAKSAPISFASPQDRHDFLVYGISVLEDISESLKNTWCTIVNRPAAMYQTKEVCMLLRKFLVLRVNGISLRQIAQNLNIAVTTALKVEELAVRAVSEAIEKKRNKDVPIIGG